MVKSRSRTEDPETLSFRIPRRLEISDEPTNPARPKNEAEITYWNSAGGRRWVERQQSQDVVLGPILQATLERAQVRQGEQVVDIGCGTGTSAIALAERVGPSGHVLGVDVSAPMLAHAAERLAPGGPVNSYAPTRRPIGSKRPLLISSFRALASCFSRSQPALFANLRTALKPGGRLAFACWRKFDENPWLKVPLRAALEHVPPLPRPGPEDPGPFSLAGEQRVHRILEAAGFHSVILEPRDFDLDIACGGGIEAALEAAMALGPQAAPCRTRAWKRVSQLPSRSATRCNPINAVSRLRFRGYLARHRKQRLALTPECSRGRVGKDERVTGGLKTLPFLGKNPGSAACDLSPQSQRRCGMVEVHVNRCGARCRPRGYVASHPRTDAQAAVVTGRTV